MVAGCQRRMERTRPLRMETLLVDGRPWSIGGSQTRMPPLSCLHIQELCRTQRTSGAGSCLRGETETATSKSLCDRASSLDQTECQQSQGVKRSARRQCGSLGVRVLTACDWPDAGTAGSRFVNGASSQQRRALRAFCKCSGAAAAWLQEPSSAGGEVAVQLEKRWLRRVGQPGGQERTGGAHESLEKYFSRH